MKKSPAYPIPQEFTETNVSSSMGCSCFANTVPNAAYCYRCREYRGLCVGQRCIVQKRIKPIVGRFGDPYNYAPKTDTFDDQSFSHNNAFYPISQILCFTVLFYRSDTLKSDPSCSCWGTWTRYLEPMLRCSIYGLPSQNIAESRYASITVFRMTMWIPRRVVHGLGWVWSGHTKWTHGQL